MRRLNIWDIEFTKSSQQFLFVLAALTAQLAGL